MAEDGFYVAGRAAEEAQVRDVAAFLDSQFFRRPRGGFPFEPVRCSNGPKARAHLLEQRMPTVQGEVVAVQVGGLPEAADESERDEPADGVPEIGVGDRSSFG